MAFIFAVLVAASIIFFGYRIVTKPAYKANEMRQCKLLAASALSILTEETIKSPNMWEKFGSDDIFLIIDHKKMPGNWVIKVEVKREAGKIHITSSAASGWNSRSPQEASFSAAVTGGEAENNTAAYSEKETADLASEIASAKSTPYRDNEELLFVLPDERKVTPARIAARPEKITGSKLIILRPTL
ncbi:MAG: hypothetical protein RR214_07065 [Synergistaceae bacterium]